jgi:hypothetical protein
MSTTTPKRNGYTEEQLKEAERMRTAGESYKAIGAALGIKATAYLSKVLKRREAEREQAERAAKPARKPRAKKASVESLAA